MRCSNATCFSFGNSGIDSVLTKVQENGVSIFWGCLPGESAEIAPPPDFTYAIPRPDEAGELTGLNWQALPPPSKILINKNTHLMGKILVAGIPRNCGARCDSLPLLSIGRYSGRTSLFCTFRDIWRWDFWPLSLGRNKEQPFAFSDRIISLAKNLLLANISRGFFMYPSQEPSETDSLRFHILFPASLNETSVVNVHFVMWGREGKMSDTTISMVGGPTVRSVTVTPPMRPGLYRYESSASSGQLSYAFSDSLVIGNDRTELMISGQNISLLNELAQPLDINDSIAVKSFRAAHSSRESGGEPVQEQIQLHRSWVLLWLILVLFATEWIIRRRMELD